MSAKEIEILRHLAHGLVYKQIALQMGVSASTIRTHLHNVYGKLGVTDRAQAVILAAEQGWLAGDIASLVPRSRNASIEAFFERLDASSRFDLPLIEDDVVFRA
ncbi:MAG: hypothetical protein BGO11_13315 [Solirubrobacterales bacterium 70-9]|nr:MAG: hypothetical protein BGO11_13315 [Solirubrobacterales bacterium 70-9]